MNFRRLLAFATLAVLLAYPAASQAAATATLTPTSAFASNNRNVDSGATATTRLYTVTSTGTDPLVVDTAALTTDAAHFTISDDQCSGKTLNQTQTCTLRVAFTPTATGARSSTLSIPTNGATLTSGALTGTGRDLRASASPLVFNRRVDTGASAAQQVTYTNKAAESYVFGAITIGGGDSGQFTKTADTCAGKTVATDESCTVDVAFNPTSPGAKSATLGIASFGPVLVSLSGNAEQPATALTPAGRTFRDLAVGAGPSAAQTFTLTSSGQGPLVTGAATLAGADAGDFAITADECSNQTLANGQSCDVSVAFAPGVAGYRRARLEIASDAATSPTVARLEGRGKGGGTDTVFDTPLVLAELPAARLTGDGGDTAGSNIGNGPCDVDGDGYDDVLTGAPLWSVTPATNSWEGAAYVSFGGPDFGSQDLQSRADSIIVQGTGESSQTSTGLGCADVNGDDIDDLLVGAWAYEYAGRPTGTAASRGRGYVVFGSKDLRDEGNIDLGLLGDKGFTITAPDAPEYDHLGYAMTGVGDLDGDGREELAIMANTGDTTDASPARSNNGILLIVPGQAGTGGVDVSASGATLARIDGASPGTSASPFGLMGTVAGLGDVNGDDIDDIGIGTYTAAAFGRTAAGAVFAISGSTRGRVDLAQSSSYLFAAGGAFASHRLGIGLDAGGDVNGDGLADIVAGADSTSAANSDAAYVIYGSGTRAAGTLLDTAGLGSDGYRIRGGAGTSTGYGVAGLGDVDGDANGDLAVGGYGYDRAAGSGSGSGWVLYGVDDPATLPADSGLTPANAADTTRTLALDGLTAAEGTRIDGQTAGERFGRSAAGVGDVDGNGATDVGFGSDFAVRRERSRAGELSVSLLPGPPAAAEPEPPAQGGDGQSPAGPPAAPAPGSGAGTSPSGSTRPLNRATPRLSTRSARLDARGQVGFTVRCANAKARCSGVMRLTVAGRWIGAVKFSVAPGASKVVRVQLSRKTRARLEARGRLKATAALRVRAAGYQGVRQAKLTVTLRRAGDSR